MSLITPIQRLVRNRPGVFTPTIVRGITESDGGLSTIDPETANFISTTALGNTGSFRYDPIGTGVKSTQQLNVDWSKFENHVFFNSAQVKVNSAFNKIIDRFPFDGTRKEVELFFDGMTGFENYVYQSFPKNKGYLFFSGSNVGDPITYGTWVTVKDVAGAPYPFLTKDPNGAHLLDPAGNSISLQFQIFVPQITNTNQFILQKYNSTNNHGFGCFLSQSASTTNAQLTFFVSSGSVNAISASINLEKGKWNPVTFIWDRNSGINKVFGYVSGTLAATSSQVEIKNLSFTTSNLYVGTGSAITAPLFVPATTFSGALDELRYYKKVVSVADMREYQSSSLYSEPELALYFKFNEPSGSNSEIVLDSSGRGMHGQLNPFASSYLNVRNISTGSLFGESPILYEDIRKCPILFPDHPEVQALRTSLLTDANLYDIDNPNIITKLVPKQYFFYGQQQDGFATEEGQLNELQYGSEPNTVKLGATQTILSLLYLWATYFDEMKIFLDAFSTLRHVDYNQFDTVPDAFLQNLADFYGIDLPPLFIGSEIDQFINGNNITPDIVNSDYTLQYIQNQIWRRILVNINDILKSKGTLHSIKSFLRTIGIEGDNIFRFKEYGGPNQRTLTSLRENRNEVGAALNFKNGGYYKSSFLSASRIEPGYPFPAGTFITDPTTGHNIDTTNPNDGLFTSGSWSYEAIYSYAGNSQTTSSVQSLVRLMSSGSANQENILANLYVTSGSGLTLYVKTNTSTLSALTMSLPQPNIMDGQAWNISFGRTRRDAIGQLSSSYFLRAARNNLGSIVEEYTTASFYNDLDISPPFDVWQELNATYNHSGSFIVIGSGSSNIPINNKFVNANSLQIFDGKVSQIRFWSKDLSIEEWREHVRDYKSLGVKDPRVNFNFENFRSGSFEKLRGDWSTDQPLLTTDGSGQIQIFDFSQHNLHASGTLFPVTSSVIVPQRFYYSFISPNFDEAVTNEKVRVRSYQNLDNVLNDEAQYAQLVPVYEITQEQIPEDNGKFSIDFSIVDSLNQDIIGMFSSLDVFNDILGSPNMLFSPDYPDLEVLQNIYFNRLTNSLNIRTFFDFYKWFNTNIGKFIEQLIPRKTRYNGINYVVESHLLERAKIEYHFENYLTSKNKIELQSLSGIIKKY